MSSNPLPYDTSFEGTLRLLCRQGSPVLVDQEIPDLTERAARAFAVFAQLGSLARPDQRQQAWTVAGEEAMAWMVSHPDTPPAHLHHMGKTTGLETEIKKNLAREMSRSLPADEDAMKENNFWGNPGLPSDLSKGVDPASKKGLLEGLSLATQMNKVNRLSIAFNAFVIPEPLADQDEALALIEASKKSVGVYGWSPELGSKVLSAVTGLSTIRAPGISPRKSTPR